MPIYRTKPVEVEARQVPPYAPQAWAALAVWCDGQVEGDRAIYVPTGVETWRSVAQVTDYIIKHAAGRFEVLEDWAFEADHTIVED